MTERTETRAAYGHALLELGERRADVVVLDADLYNSTRSILFGRRFPERFLDVGIAEQDMVSMAAGLAASGLVPYCHSFGVFLTGRCYDQIRTQVCYPALPVKLCGSSAGLTHGPDGASHQALEDISLMRGLPNMTVIVPADDIETRQATLAAADIPGPVYLRVGRYPVPRLFGPEYSFRLGQIYRLRDGWDVVVLATGHMVWKALETADLLAHAGIGARVVNVSTIKPLDADAVVREMAGMRYAFTVEEHNIIGGLGSAIAEVLAESTTARIPLKRLGVRDVFGESGTADELLARHDLDAGGIRRSIITSLNDGA
jgi:transketolase